MASTADVALSDLRNPSKWLLDAVGGKYTQSGEFINTETALHISAYFACARSIAEDVAKIPKFVFQRLGGNGKEKARKHPTYRVVHSQAAPNISSQRLRECVTFFALTWGNGYAQIGRDVYGGPVTSLKFLHPSYVTPYETMDGNDVAYKYVNPKTQKTTLIPGLDMIHIRPIGCDILCGMSILRIGAESLGLTKASETFGASFFGKGASPNIALSYPGKLDKESRDNVDESLVKKNVGAYNAGTTMVLEEGFTVQKIGIPPNEAQFLETRQFQVEEVCRWFRMPPHKIQHLLRSTFSNIEHQSIEYVIDTLLPWIIRWEQEENIKLFPYESEEGTYFVEHMLQGLLRGDNLARATYFKEQIMIGAMNPNEVREEENRNPRAGGDRFYMPLNTAPLDETGMPIVPEPASAQQGNQNQPPDNFPANPPGASSWSILEPIFLSLATKVVKKQRLAVERAMKKYQNDPANYSHWEHGFKEEMIPEILEIFEPCLISLHKIDKRVRYKIDPDSKQILTKLNFPKIQCVEIMNAFANGDGNESISKTLELIRSEIYGD